MAEQQSVVTVCVTSEYESILAEFPELTNPSLLGKSAPHNTVHHILTRGQPVTAKPRRLHPSLHAAVKTEFEFLLEQGVIRPSKSSWSSPLHVVPKHDSTVRPVGDYRNLNSVTEFDSYPIPYLQDFAHALHGKTVFSKVDIFKAFHQIPIAEADIPKTAVTTPWGLYEYTHLCFGLVNAPQTFMRFMHEVLRGLPFCYVYLDDILCFSDNTEEHKQHLHTLFQRLHTYGLRLNISKCEFGVSKLNFLGHVITPKGIQPLPEKVQAILDYKLPESIAALRRFLGLINFYRRFVPHAAEHQFLLSKLLKGTGKKRDKSKINWPHEAVSSFQKCKQALAEATLLAHPDPAADLALHVDASDYAIGGALHQIVNSELQPLGFFSRQLNSAELSYSAYDRELLAAYSAVKHFRHMLEAREFTLFTDHKPLTFAFRQKNDKCSPRQIRQLDFLSQFTTHIHHIPGPENIVADVLSRVSAIHTPHIIDYKEIAESQKRDPELTALMSSDSPLQLKKITFPESEAEIVCDFSTGTARPYIPQQHRQQVFSVLHNLAHPGIRRSVHLLKKRFVWPSMSADIRKWAKHCIPCQQSKVQRHTRAPLASFKEPSSRFDHVHLDLIGPLPPSNGFTHCLTMIDRFSRWPEAYPLRDISAEAVAEAFFTCWVSRYGVPAVVTTDQGRQFEASLFRALTNLLGTHRSRSTSYHPQANGLIEELHRPLKAAIKCHATERWTEVLPVVLLGLRTALKEDLGCTPADLVFGTTLCLPGEFLDPTKPSGDPITFVSKLQSHMQAFRPLPPKHHGEKKIFVHPELFSTSHVFLRRDMVRRPLQQPYDGPFKVISRSEKVFHLDVRGKPTAVSIDRLKPAFILADMPKISQQRNTPSIPVTSSQQADRPGTCSQQQDVPSPSSRPLQQTRSGRRVQFPARYR